MLASAHTRFLQSTQCLGTRMLLRLFRNIQRTARSGAGFWYLKSSPCQPLPPPRAADTYFRQVKRGVDACLTRSYLHHRWMCLLPPYILVPSPNFHSPCQGVNFSTSVCSMNAVRSTHTSSHASGTSLPRLPGPRDRKGVGGVAARLQHGTSSINTVWLQQPRAKLRPDREPGSHITQTLDSTYWCGNDSTDAWDVMDCLKLAHWDGLSRAVRTHPVPVPLKSQQLF